MAYTFFKHHHIFPKDICDYIITFVGYSDDDVEFFKLFTYSGMVNTINFQYDLYNEVILNHRWHEYRQWDSFIKYMLRIKGCHHRALMRHDYKIFSLDNGD